MPSSEAPNLSAELAALDAKVNALLPARYQHSYEEVSPTSMGSAGLKYAPNGRVAWEDIWTTFCDLALAGGPPHRGKLLEPVPEAAVMAQMGYYRDVVREIDRAVGLTTGCAVVEGDTPGWVHVKCASAEEAAWLQFAVTAENVSARRRGGMLLLPAGPAFTPEKEIKNVVVALAKSYHYWDGHLTASQQTLASDSAWEPASPTEVAANPSLYEQAAIAIEKALRASGRTTMPRRYAGWVGTQMRNEEEAVWILRAILAEQVLARREERVLYLPVGAVPNADQEERVGFAFAQAWRLWEASSSSSAGW